MTGGPADSSSAETKRPSDSSGPGAPPGGSRRSADPPPLQTELLYSFGLLFAVAVLLAVFAVGALFPNLRTPRQTTIFLTALMTLDLMVLFGFGSFILRRKLVSPVEHLVDDVRRMAEGGRHRVGPMQSAELQTIGESVNALADRLMSDQALLAANVSSLEHTNAELVEARNQMVRADRLASVGTLAAGIAHEIGNPLAAILGYADVARSRALREGHDPALLEAVKDEARRIDGIVRSLLDYARPPGDEAALVAPASVLERVRSLLGAQGKLDAAHFEWRFEEGLPVVRIEPSRLEQVIVNLLLNALDAVEGRAVPRIVVSATSERGALAALPLRREADPSGVNYLHRRRAAGAEGRGGVDPLFTAERVVVIRIEDNGPGIQPRDLAHVFDPFFTTKAPGKGTGLGLAICAQLVESIDGRIGAANAEGGGAVFTVRIPSNPAPGDEGGEAAGATRDRPAP